MKREIKSGVYLVVDPGMEREILLEKLKMALNEELAAIQIWDNFGKLKDPESLIKDIIQLSHQYDVPVLVNNKWRWLKTVSQADGVHFDEIPEDIDEIRKEIEEDRLIGLTITNDLKAVKWARKNNLSYISFCAVFPSPTSNSCEMVRFDTIKAARSMTSMPIFLSGGITPEKLKELAILNYDGVAVVSGIMNSNFPNRSVKHYLNELKRHEAKFG